MRLVSAAVRNFKSVADSTQFTLQPEVTCLVGKNESGKTAVMEAMYRVNPVPTGHPRTFDGLRDYPRRNFARDRQKLPRIEPVETTWVLSKEDEQAFEEKFGEGALNGNEVTVSRDYSNGLTVGLDYDLSVTLKHVLDGAGLDPKLADSINAQADLISKLEQKAEGHEGVAAFVESLSRRDLEDEIRSFVVDQLPRLWYFDQYSTLPGTLSIHKLQNTAEADLDPGERTGLALLRLAGVETEEFTEESYEARKAALEAAANALTDEVFTYWTQNTDLAVELDVDFKAKPDRPGEQPPFLEIRIRNNRHRVTLNFAERSTGFVWFFSFLAAFSEFRDGVLEYVLLLDEPGLGLHAAAQSDLLRYIDAELAPNHQVVYTTHSPFLVDPTDLGRARAVQDVDGEGTKVFDDVYATSRDTLFPLQAALGYEISQTLFVGPDVLVVEGPSDLVYLQVMSEHLGSLGRTGLDERWVITPVGGMDKIPTFLALLNTQVNAVALLDVAAGGNQKVNGLVDRDVIDADRLVPLTMFTGGKEADIEDLFDEGFYLHLVDKSGIGKVAKSKLATSGRLTKRVEAALDQSYSHYRPARQLTRDPDAALKLLGDESLDRFEALFRHLNGLLSRRPVDAGAK